MLVVKRNTLLGWGVIVSVILGILAYEFYQVEEVDMALTFVLFTGWVVALTTHFFLWSEGVFDKKQQ